MPITNKQIHDELKDDGTIARVNRNTSFRKGAQKTLWSIWIVIVGILGKLIFWN